MLNNFKFVVSTIAVLTATMSSALASVPMGRPLGARLGQEMGSALPFADAGILGLAAAGVIGGVWLARRKR